MCCLRSVMAHTQSRNTAAARNWSSTPPAQERCAPGKVAKMRAVSGTDLAAGWKHDTCPYCVNPCENTNAYNKNTAIQCFLII